ncbi:hypothetical protein [Pelagibius sp. Alg239-R121]|uniref:hypothetical protein n=1 Tax=Pelagibius sp. Alg239-R121 TaxID=2993448 RepID=UPI0024A674DA|nr:hypothetical protein [Pelagibius sp. Alg239-R121]
MNELIKISPNPAKVTVARPLGRALSNSGSRPVEAVPPVVLDNDAALGFLRERSRQTGSGRGEADQTDRRLPRGEQARAGETGSPAQRRADAYDDSRNKASGTRHQFPSKPSLSAASNTGFVAHLMAQHEDGQTNASSSFQRQELIERYGRSSEAYRRAGAEPAYYGQASQVVRVAV